MKQEITEEQIAKFKPSIISSSPSTIMSFVIKVFQSTSIPTTLPQRIKDLRDMKIPENIIERGLAMLAIMDGS